MNEAETRAERIDPKLRACGWGLVEGSKVLREYNITAGVIQTGGGRGKREIADYVPVYKGIKLAVVEAKSDELEVWEVFPISPFKAQQAIVRQLDALRAETQKLEAVYQKKIADLEELKKSILQKAFAGELKTEKFEPV